jgi:hypothetical protein
MPNSKRPSLRWSIIATRSATRAGWFTGGVMLKMPVPTWMRSVLAATKARNDSLAERWEYSVRKWCSLAHVYLNPLRSAAWIEATSSRSRRCSMTGSEACSCGRYRALKSPNSTPGA